MAEAVLTRSTTIPEEVLNPIYPVNGYHVILVTVRTNERSIVQGYPVRCTDGLTNYDYYTNDKGQVKFSCNSGSANIFINNICNGITYIDFHPSWTNVGAPIGDVSRINIVLNNQPISELLSSCSFSTIEDRTINTVYIVGGGGGGGSGGEYDVSDGSWKGCGGGGGGAGYMNNYYNKKFIRNNTYKFISGAGGHGGYAPVDYSLGNNGNSGGTSYIENMNISAIGGQGGKHYIGSKLTNAKGGLGNGSIATPAEMRDQDSNKFNNGANSPVTFAGGGGGSGVRSRNGITTIGGTPYGGGGAMYKGGGGDRKSIIGQRGGGGGGGWGAGDVWTYTSPGATGGAGMVRFEF